jgi:hypothetical protein
MCGFIAETFIADAWRVVARDHARQRRLSGAVVLPGGVEVAEALADDPH